MEGTLLLPRSQVSRAGEEGGGAAPGGGGIIPWPLLVPRRRPGTRGDDGGGDSEVVGAQPTPGDGEVVRTAVVARPRARASPGRSARPREVLVAVSHTKLAGAGPFFAPATRQRRTKGPPHPEDI